jgi:peptidoglycan/xylan/chitin deacetylase (PgdA/CDA1 family)
MLVKNQEENPHLRGFKTCGISATLRDSAKATAERMLLSGAGLSLLRRRMLKEVIIFAYHNVVPEGNDAVGEQSLHLPQRAFAAQLDALTKTHRVVRLDEVFTPAASQPDRPRAVITFDDAYLGALTAGVAELRKRGMPATIFVAPGFVPGGDFWWDVLARDGELNSQVRGYGLEACCGRDREVRDWAARSGLHCGVLPDWARAGSESDIRAAVNVGGITLGSHTWSHCNLSRVPLAEAEQEMRSSLQWLRERFTETIPWLSYPYGLSTPEVEQLAKSVGYAGAVRIDGGWLQADESNRYAVPRLNVPSGISREGFRLRAAGLISH